LLALERRRIVHPKGLGLRRFSKWDYSRDLRPAKCGLIVILRVNNPRMSALGQKRTLKRHYPMSALPPKTNIRILFDHVIGSLMEKRGDVEAEQLGCCEINH